MNILELKRKIFDKPLQTNPEIAVFKSDELADRLVHVNDLLKQNLLEWLEDKPLSDIWIDNKYCIGSILKLSGDTNFASALIALDDYAKDKSKEYVLWS